MYHFKRDAEENLAWILRTESDVKMDVANSKAAYQEMMAVLETANDKE